MNSVLRIATAVLLLAPLGAAESLDSLLDRMNQSAKEAKSFTADLHWTHYTAVLDLKEESTGEIRLQKKGSNTLGIVDFKAPNEKKAIFAPGTFQQYLPKANVLEVYQLGKQAKLVDKYLLLVFGVSGNDLKKDYQVKFGGEETLGGVKTTRIELTPKEKEAKDLVAKLELWIPEGKTYAIQQKVIAPSNDYDLWVYSNVKINPDLPDSAFTFTPPAGVQKKILK